MGCKHKYKKMDMDYDRSSAGDISMKELAKQGNRSIDGMIGKCPAVKRKGCR